MVLDKLKTNSSFSNSRFAVEVLIASSDNVNSTATIVSQKSLDDEHSPGVFTVRTFCLFLFFLRIDVRAEFVDVDAD
jgi:hypothetical protein